MPADIKVLKFGGTSVEDWPAFERAAQIVRANTGDGLVLIVSAMSGFTDALIKSFRGSAAGEIAKSLQLLEEHFERHLKVARNLSASSLAMMQALIEKSRWEISKLLALVAAGHMSTPPTQDQITSQGELLCANLFTLVLEQHGVPASYVDARRCILTNDAHGSASPLIQEVLPRTKAQLEPLLQKKKVPVLGGFVGATVSGITTTLGRGSSDYSATLIAAALDACEVQIWTDVDGVQTGDPSLVESAHTVSNLSYREAAQLARLGARLIHAKMIGPVIDRKIPIRIRNSRTPERNGTLISAKGEPDKGIIKAIAYRSNLSTIAISSTPAFVANGFRHALSEIFMRHKTELDLVTSSKVGVTFAYEGDGISPSILHDLEQLGSVKIRRERAIVGCVGDGLRSDFSDSTMIGSLLKLDSSLTWQASSNNNLITVIDADKTRSIVRRLHRGLFE